MQESTLFRITVIIATMITMEIQMDVDVVDEDNFWHGKLDKGGQ